MSAGMDPAMADEKQSQPEVQDQPESWGTMRQPEGEPATANFEPQGTHPDQPLQEPDPSQIPASNQQQPQS